MIYTYIAVDVLLFGQADAMIGMIGYPDYILNATMLDERYREVSPKIIYKVKYGVDSKQPGSTGMQVDWWLQPKKLCLATPSVAYGHRN